LVECPADTIQNRVAGGSVEDQGGAVGAIVPHGKGRPENANVSGLSYEYIVQQLTDFKNGLRKTSDPRKLNTGLMAGFAKQMTDDEIKAAARYFSAIPSTPWIKVVESDTVPKTNPAGGIFITVEGAGAGTEPLGQRIIETPVNAEHTEYLRDPRSGFIAYVPPGSVKKGEALVTTGAGKVTACTACHGAAGEGGVRVRMLGSAPYAYMTTNPLSDPRSVGVGDPTQFEKLILEGMPGYEMPGNGDLSKDEIRQLYDFTNGLRSRQPRTAPAPQGGEKI